MQFMRKDRGQKVMRLRPEYIVSITQEELANISNTVEQERLNIMIHYSRGLEQDRRLQELKAMLGNNNKVIVPDFIRGRTK